MDRATFYKLKKRIKGLPKSEWLGALNDLPRRWKSHGQQTPEKERQEITKLAIKHPTWGCNRIQKELARQRITRSHNTIQKILNGEQLGTKTERWKFLDKPDVKHSAEQIAFIETMNPGPVPVVVDFRGAAFPGRTKVPGQAARSTGLVIGTGSVCQPSTLRSTI